MVSGWLGSAPILALFVLAAPHFTVGAPTAITTTGLHSRIEGRTKDATAIRRLGQTMSSSLRTPQKQRHGAATAAARKQVRDLPDLSDSVVWVTGASSGLGEALACQFASRGARVILSGRNTDQLKRVQSRCIREQQDADHTAAPTKLSTKLSRIAIETLPRVAEVVSWGGGGMERTSSCFLDCAHDDRASDPKHQEAEAIFGRIDTLVLCGGISTRGEIKDSSWKLHNKVLAVNHMSSVALSIPVAEGMAARGSGHIIHINSVQGKLGLPSRAAYAASKHASIGFFDSLRAEVANFGIRVTAVLPGYINTNLSKNAITASGAQYNKTDPSTAKGMNASTVAERLARLGEKHDIVWVVHRSTDPEERTR
eukprot:jgi/Bigna1/82504/fgenesh1_pg.93_\